MFGILAQQTLIQLSLAALEKWEQDGSFDTIFGIEAKVFSVYGKACP